MFRSARLKLTAWYLLIILVVSLLFSGIIYKVLTNEVDRFERVQRYRFNPELIAEVKDRILFSLLGIDLGIFIIAGGLGYFLAGRTLKPIQEMVDEQNRFISDASHELKTPLTSLKTAFEVYLRQKQQSQQETKSLVKESMEEVNKLQSLSESLLQLTQYQKPNGHNQFERISISKIAEEAIHKIEPQARKKKIVLENKIKEQFLQGNKYSLVDLLVILLDNAIKYSKNGSKIILSSQRKDHQFVVSIQDFGLGISDQDLPYVFDRFYRADTARSKQKVSGYGLGLSIAKQIVDTHHGLITVQSRLGQGSTFSIVFPIS